MNPITKYSIGVLFLCLLGCSNQSSEDVSKLEPPDANAKIRATVNGKYSELLKRLRIPKDRADYGDFYDWGKWNGSEYKDHSSLPQGYWVYVYPDWYIWKKQAIRI